MEDPEGDAFTVRIDWGDTEQPEVSVPAGGAFHGWLAMIILCGGAQAGTGDMDLILIEAQAGPLAAGAQLEDVQGEANLDGDVTIGIGRTAVFEKKGTPNIKIANLVWWTCSD